MFPGVLALTQVALWLWRPALLSRALFRGPLDLSVAAWSSLGIVTLSSSLVLHRLMFPSRRVNPGPWTQIWSRVVQNRSSRVGARITLLYLLVALLAPAMAPLEANRIGDGLATHSLPPFSRLHLLTRRDGSVFTANEVELAGEKIRFRQGRIWSDVARQDLQGSQPSDWHRTRVHVLGTDHLGRDLLSRLLLGSRISLGVGLLAALMAMTLGALVGGLAGWSGSRLDSLLMRFTDAVHAFPRLFLILLVLAVLPGSFLAVVMVLAITGWMVPCRLVRSKILSLREQDFVTAARASGRTGATIILRHLLPNAFGPLLVATTLRIGDTMLVEAGLAFLGLGVPPPHASWGTLISAGQPTLIRDWWMITFPGLAIVTSIIAFHLLGDGLRRAMTPR